MVIKSKRTSYGLIEVRTSSVLGWYCLYINGEIKEHSADKAFILKQYDKY
jgi:hypothetical protein